MNAIQLVHINTAAQPSPEDKLDEITNEIDIDLN